MVHSAPIPMVRYTGSHLDLDGKPCPVDSLCGVHNGKPLPEHRDDVWCPLCKRVVPMSLWARWWHRGETA